MKTKLKLTDEELSRVLGEADAGRLNHHYFRDDLFDCGCVAGAAYIAGGFTHRTDLPVRAMEISDAIGPAEHFVYPHGPDAVLRMLENKGLA